MEEKAKSKVLIYIIVVLVAIIVLLSIGGIYLYKELSKQGNDNQLQSELNQQEKQVDKEIQIINDKEAKQNILVNGKVVEVKATITDIKQSQEHTYAVSTKVEIEGKETEKIEELAVLAQNINDIKASNIYGNITTIKGEDNKDYIIIVLHDFNDMYYILNENGQIIAEFVYSWYDRVKIGESEEWEDSIQIKDNYIIEYDYWGRYKGNQEGFEEGGVVLKKWKNTIKDSKLICELIDTYTEEEIETGR